MVSMKDIAQACGVSVASVSKALNNHTDIGEETRQLIRRTAKEMGLFSQFRSQDPEDQPKLQSGSPVC